MNYYAARQNSKTGKWKYIMFDRDSCYSVGYCSGDKCEGHDTKEEAEEHYKQYLLDTRLEFYNPEDDSVQHKCQICEKFTFGKACIDGFTIFNLCEEHQSKEIISQLYGKVGESWSSY